MVTFEGIFGRLNILAGSLPAPVLNKLPQPKSHSPRNRNCRHLPRQSFIAGISISQEVRCLKDIVGKAKQDRRFRLGPSGFPDFRYKTKLQCMLFRGASQRAQSIPSACISCPLNTSVSTPEPSTANQTQSPKCEDFQRLRAAVFACRRPGGSADWASTPLAAILGAEPSLAERGAEGCRGGGGC